MKVVNRKSVFCETKDYCHFAKDDNYIEVTEWSNGEGIDISVEDVEFRTFSITHGQFELIKKLVKKLNK